jgi:hypothetical protein
MKKLILLLLISATAFIQSCEKCYTCTNKYNADDIIDHCGRGKDLDKAVDIQEALGYNCEKR